MPIYDGNSVRFTADDFEPGSAQHAIAAARSSPVGGTVAPVATTWKQGDVNAPWYHAYDHRVSRAWINPQPDPLVARHGGKT